MASPRLQEGPVKEWAQDPRRRIERPERPADLDEYLPHCPWPEDRGGVAYRPIDEEHAWAYNRLYNKVFEQRRPLEHCLWKFWQAPAGPPVGFVALEQDTSRVLCANPAIRKDLRIQGEDKQAILVCESATDPEARGGGRLYFHTTLGTGRLGADMRGVMAYGGRSTDEAIKIGWRWFRYRVPFELQVWEKRLSLKPALRSRFGALGSAIAAPLDRLRPAKSPTQRSGFEFQIGTEFGPEFDEMWERYRDLYPLVLRRDQAVLHWRYQQCPVYRHQFLLARRQGEAVGYLVWRNWIRDGVALATVMDLWDGRDPKIAAFLLTSLESVASDQGCEFLQFAVMPESAGEAALQQIPGFEPSDREPPDRIITTPLPILDPSDREYERMRLVIDGRNWYYTPGDCDFLD